MQKFITRSLFTFLLGSIILCSPGRAAYSGELACSNSTGPGFGLCIAASHLGCGTDEEANAEACGSLERNYLKLTGDIPPWLFMCPCWDRALIREQGDITQCEIQSPNIPDGGAFAWDGGFGYTQGGSLAGGIASCGIGPIDNDIIIISPITEEENDACLAQIIAACAEAGF